MTPNDRSRSTAMTTNLLPAGPRTLSAQFPGSTQQYDYFIPPGVEVKVGDVILTSTLWGAVPGAGKLKDNILSAGAGMSVRSGGRAVPKSRQDTTFLDDEDPDDDGVTVTLTDHPLSTGDQDKPFAIAAAVAFAEKLKPAIVTGIHTGTSPKAHRYFILTLPIVELHQRKEALDAVIMRTVQQIHARTRLAEIVREQAEMDLFKKVAATNPEAQRLIAILEGKDPQKS